MTSNLIYRQGDVLIRQVAGIPTDQQVVQRGPGTPVILALGEATGHVHAIHEAKVTAYSPDGAELAPKAGGYLHVEAEARLVHEEHRPITLPPGFYKVIRQVEYPWVEEGARAVAD